MARPSLFDLPPTRLDRRQVLSLLLIPSYIAILAALYLLHGTAAYTEPLVLLLLNTAFLGLIPLYVAYVSLVAFRESGLAGVLFMGAGMLIFGLGSIAAGLAGLLPDSANLSVTLFNVGACAGAFLQFAGALTALLGWLVRPAERRTAVAAAVYAGAVLIFAAVVLAALQDLTPVFFVSGSGSTGVRNLVLAGAVEFFLIASGLFFVLYRRRDEDFFFWYAVGMALIGIGLVAVTFIVTFDSAFNWAARAGQYMGAIYILVALQALQRRASSGSVSVQGMLARLFAESEAGYRQLIETAGDAIVVLDSANRVLLWNAAATRMLGYTQDEAVGMSFPDLVLGDSNASVLEGDAAGNSRELAARRRDGIWVSVELTVSRRDVAGAVVSTCILRDITERKEAEQALREYAENLARSNEDLERFAYVSSHDLQEPLRAIVSFSQLLQKRYRGRLDQDADEYIEFIVEGGTRMQALIQDLLAYSRVNTVRQDHRPTDTRDVLAAVERSLDLQLREAGAAITYDGMPTMLADPLQLEQVFVNLVSNAIKFRRPDDPLRIRVGARRTDGFREFSVADNGIGIEPEYFDRIFVIFQRLHTKDAYPGTGIGLAIVKRIVDRHGGTIGVESTPGAGSTFVFTLPTA